MLPLIILRWHYKVRANLKIFLKDATGKPGLSPRMTLIALLRVPVHGFAFDQVDEELEIAETII